MKKARYLLEYMAVKMLLGFFGLMPLSLSARIWKGLALTIYKLGPSLKKTAQENIRMTIGQDWGQDRIEDLLRQLFIHMGYFIAEFIHSPKIGLDFNRQVTIRGDEQVRAALADKKGAILLTGHFGNWELVGYSLKILGFKMHTLYKKMSNPLVDRLLLSHRHRHTGNLIEIEDYKEKTSSALAQNELIGIIPDQDARHHGIFIDFLGKPASTYIGPALLSLQHGAPLFAVFFRRKEVGSYDLTFNPIETPPPGDLQESIRFLTRQWVELLEHNVRAYPDQYFWFHRRWKTQPRDQHQ
ncbi:lysophospholipid acyltransferase family protein [bacterium]|nr:lysophospholipid acyltransferase family protein [bacterium]